MHVSLWEQESFYAPHDYIIAGAGLAGLWTAVELKRKKPGASILLIERGSIPNGASTRNAGFACFGSPTEMISDSANMGEDSMWSVVEMRYRGIEKTRQHFGDLVIDFDHCGGYECYKENDNQLLQVADRLEWLNTGMEKIMGKPYSFTWANEKLKQFGFEGFGGMIENKLEGGLHSGKLVQALLQKVVSAGVHILFGTNIIGWQKHNNEIEVITTGKSLRCNSLVLATNAFLPKIDPSCTIKPARGQVLLTSEISNLPVSGTFHYDEGYYYFRNVGNRVLLGGARNCDFEAEATDELATTMKVQDTLEQFLLKHILPATDFSITNRWSGIMGFTKNKLPEIRQVEENVWSIAACNGMGVALTPIIAEVVTQQLTGSFNEYQHASSLLLSPTN